MPDDYPTIQAAVDAAAHRDTIIVMDGTYNETINVEKRLTIRSENDTGKCMVHAAKSSNSAFEVMGDYVSISGFSVDGVSNYEKAGLFLGYPNYCDISNNNFMNNTDSVDSYESTNTWNSTKEIRYNYNENSHTNFLGNYWDDYAGNEAGLNYIELSAEF